VPSFESSVVDSSHDLFGRGRTEEKEKYGTGRAGKREFAQSSNIEGRNEVKDDGTCKTIE
jgi:hypothetical protein